MMNKICLLYTSDAADDPLCCDLGGRRVVKKKYADYQVHKLTQKHSLYNDRTTK